MGLYNVLFGQSDSAPILMAALGLTRDQIYRYRDCYLTEDGHIAIYTRGGGGNRECYCRDLPRGQHEEGCVKSLQNALRQHPNYVDDSDDDFDCTYATFYFSIPTEAEERIKAVVPEESREQVWNQFFERLQEAKQA